MIEPEQPDQGFDDTICAHCQEKLPDSPVEGSWGWYGFCGPACCLHHLLTVAGLNRIAGADATLGRRAITELSRTEV